MACLPTVCRVDGFAALILRCGSALWGVCGSCGADMLWSDLLCEIVVVDRRRGMLRWRARRGTILGGRAAWGVGVGPVRTR